MLPGQVAAVVLLSKPSFNNFLSPFLQFPPSFLIGTPVKILRTDGLYPYSTYIVHGKRARELVSRVTFCIFSSILTAI